MDDLISKPMPGPWTYTIATNGYWVRDAAGVVLAVVRKAEVAKRLTAWPDMLEALQAVLAAEPWGDQGDPVWAAQVRAAVGKAVGLILDEKSDAKPS